ncbi:MAG: hypothetical protein C7B44_01430 [Sulfobacillus thermosulfidooxidans]|nr:MAG: hypothetical protein C7B44_01430 [Sulfobacillus thermosulfidooxidans]
MHSNNQKAQALAHAIEPLVSTSYPITLPPEYRYAHLSLALIDTIFSLGAKYESTQKTVLRYAQSTGLTRFRTALDVWPPISEQQPISALLAQYRERGLDAMCFDVLNNRQRTSTHKSSSITKAEAVFRAARLLVDYDVNYFQDIPKMTSNEDFARDFRAIPGQSSGTGLAYWWMLTGSEDRIKPDRMVMRFMANVVERQSLSPEEAQRLAEDALTLLQPQFPLLTLRQMDYLIWVYERHSQTSTNHP